MRPNSSVPPQPKASTPSLRTTSALERSLHDGLIANPPPGAPRFDDQVDLAHKQMRTCTFSRTADGMQTQESFIQYLEQLDREITAHSDAAVAAGGEPIERPVVLCLDNHASRYSEEAQGGVGSVVATGHPPLHRGADDVRLPAVARPVQRPWAGWKRCPACGPKKGLCKVRACSAARKPLLLGYNPAVDAQEGA